MKTRKVLLGLASSFFLVANLNAADLCVNESGSGGCYPTITAAINAASDGDRILIQPKSGGASYAENLTIAKSLQLLSNVEGTMWVMTGNISITPAISRKISILHMKNTTGYISVFANSSVGARCEINIMNCELLNGYIDLNKDYLSSNVASNILSDGYVAIRYGNIIGNSINATVTGSTYNAGTYYKSLIYVYSDVVPTNDTLNIVGNKMSATGYYYANFIYWTSSSQFFNISNNYGFQNYNSSYQQSGISIYDAKNSAIASNKVINNTMYSTTTYSSTFYPVEILVNSVPNCSIDVLNNLLLTAGGTHQAIRNYYGSAVISCSYNFINNSSTLYNIVDDGTNTFSSNTTVNTTTGKPNVGSDAINGGYPDFTYYDIDLTVNDAGCYGGSFTLDNFYPINGSARVYFVNAPRTILQSGTLKIRANSFDR